MKRQHRFTKQKWCRNRQFRQKSPNGYNFTCRPISDDCKLWIARLNLYPTIVIKFSATISDQDLGQIVDQKVNAYLDHLELKN